MKKYSLLIVLGCFANGSFASETFDYMKISEDAPMEALQERGIGRSVARLNAFLRSLHACRIALGTALEIASDMLESNDMDSETSDELRRHIDDIVACIDNMKQKISGIMAHLQEAEFIGNLETDEYFEGINFDTLLDGFIRTENVTLQWLESHKNSMSEELYNRIKRALKISMTAALALKLVTIVGTEVDVFGCGNCCILL
jgi:hypothetical protein